MAFWSFMLVIDLLVPAVMVWLGRKWMRGAPKNISMWYGYRTEMSMKNRETWEFAHRYCGKLWFWCGAAMALVTIAAMLLFLGKDMDTVAIAGTVVCLVQLVPMVLTLIPVEIALRRKFDGNGKRRKV